MDCDLVVLGAGGSGLVAAVKAFDLTGKKVIVLEKSKKPGGATYFAGVMGEVGPIKDSKWQKDAGYKVNEPQDISGQFFDWLVSKGDAETFFTVAKPEEKRQSAIYWNERQEKYRKLPDPSIGPGKMGSFVVDKLMECCQKSGIQVLTETRARKFITDDKGKVTGVIADTNDGQLLVNCNACVIAAGGYGANMEMLKKYYPKEFNNTKIHSLCPPACTGDCIIAAKEAGAYIDPTVQSIEFPGGFFGAGTMHHPYSWALASLMGNGMFVSINLYGKRWKNDGGFGGGDAADLGDQPGGVAYAVADNEIVETAGSQMMNQKQGSPGEGSSGLDERTAIKKWREDLEYEATIDDEGASGNHTKKANTLAELALKMKIDPKTFVDTIERYNKFCETGKDLDFGKSAQMLKPIKTPPFWAIFGHRWSQCTKGRNGVAVNSKFQALNTKGEVMPGLYAAGDGCTIFGGLVMNKSSNQGMPGGASSGAAAGAPADISATAPGAGVTGSAVMGAAVASNTAAPAAAAPGGGAQGAAPGGNAQGAAPGGGMPMMGGSSQNILKGEGSPCGGLGAAFLSGYYAGIYAADYLKNI